MQSFDHRPDVSPCLSEAYGPGGIEGIDEKLRRSDQVNIRLAARRLAAGTGELTGRSGSGWLASFPNTHEGKSVVGTST